YSKGQYLAFNVDYYEIPEEIGGSDTDEMNFWNIEESSHLVGKGQTITEAAADLLIKLNEDKL
ncbi:MAG: hypothetical protein GY777_11755, partial [Candidatus Brocadiaceae bacterium]|nr:hypothetical protein [Candidatus Brocadiaceae bacterium]